MARILISGILATMLWCFVVGLDCSPTAPPPTQLSRPVVYFNDLVDTNSLIAFDVESMTVDTVQLPFWFGPITVSADGSELLCSNYDLQGRDFTWVVSTENFQVKTHYTFSASIGVALSQDSRYLAFIGSDLTLLDRRTEEVVFRDTATQLSASFSPRSHILYSTKLNNDSLFVLSLRDLSFTAYEFMLHAGRLKVTPDGSRLIAVRGISGQAYEVILYDLISHTIIFTFLFGPASGDLAVSPNGRFAVTAGSGGLLGPYGRREFYIIELQQPYHVDSISTDSIGFTDTRAGLVDGMGVRSLAIANDNRSIVGGWAYSLFCFDYEDRSTKAEYFIGTFFLEQAATAIR